MGSQKEKDEARLFFSTVEGKNLEEKINKCVKEEAETVFDDGEGGIENLQTVPETFSLSESVASKKMRQVDDEQRAKIKKAILAATSIEEIERLNRMLQAGYLPEDM